MKSLKNNFIYSFFYQLLAVIVPMITIPYASRKLGVSGIGSYSYTYSIAYYFMIAAILGLNSYGSREIAKNNKDLEKTSCTFWELYSFQLIFSLFIYFLYIIFVIIFGKNKFLLLIQSLYVMSSMFDVNWFFNGIEKFKITVIRNSIIKILSLFLILIFVKEMDDVWIYCLILSGCTLISNILLMFCLKNNIIYKKVLFKDVVKHFKPCLILFIPVIAMKIYKVMDKTMIGIFSSMSEVGFYSNADSFINVPMGIIIALGSIMLPRITYLMSNKKNQEALNLLEKSFKISLFIMFPIFMGIVCISNNFSVLFFGKEFEKTGLLISILSITMVFMTVSNFLRTQYLIPNNKDKDYICSVVLGAIINIILNIFFIPKYGSLGACIGTISAEFIVMFYQILSVRKELDIKKYLKNIIPFFIKSFIMFVIVYSFNYINMNSLIRIFIQVLVGGLVYFCLNYKFINSIIDFKQIVLKFRKRVN